MTADYAQAVRNRQAWAAVEDGEIAGFAILIARPGYLLLDNVAVLPAAQGRRIGARLLALAEDHARGLGLSEIRLYTNEAMTRTSPATPSMGIPGPTGPSKTAFAGCSSVNPSTYHPTRGRTVRLPGAGADLCRATRLSQSLLVSDVIVGHNAIETAGPPAAAPESGGPNRTGTSRSDRVSQRARCRPPRCDCLA
jgi:hypothetical protein